MKKRIISIMMALILAIPVTGQELTSEKRNLSEKTGLIRPETIYIPENELPKDYTYERKVIGSSAYGTGVNREWAEYSTYYYYNQLTDAEKEFYDDLMAECMVYLTAGGDISMSSSGFYCLPGVTYPNMSQSRAMDIYYNVFRASNPQFYFLMNNIVYNSRSIYPVVYADFAYESSRQYATQQMKSAVSDYVSEASRGSTEYDKVKVIHDRICESVTYNNDAAYGRVREEESFSQSAYSLFILRNTVCAGYAAAFAMICNKLGIDAIVETSEGHAWNRVSVDDIWYVIDCTWDDRDNEGGLILNYEFFLRSYAMVRNLEPDSSHVTENVLVPYMPSCTMDCTPSGSYSTVPGTLPVVTETAGTPVLTESDGSFTLYTSDNARIYYTIDGSTPSEGQGKSNLYKSAVALSGDAVVKAYAVVDRKKNSPVGSWAVGTGYNPTPTPTIVPTPTVIPTPTIFPTPTLIPTPTLFPSPTVTPTPTPTSEPSEYITILPSEVTIEVGETYQLYVDSSEPDEYIGWRSSNESVATVEDGMIKGISKGTAIITANAGSASSSVMVTVKDYGAYADATIWAGQRIVLRADKKIKKLKVSNKSVVKAVKNGKKIIVKGKKAGIATITAYGKKGKLLDSWVIEVEDW